MEEMINNENDWDHVTEASEVEGPIEKIPCKELAIAIKMMKPGKAAGSSEVCAEMISASGEVRVSVILELSPREECEKNCKGISG